jgi:hypothetical protein
MALFKNNEAALIGAAADVAKYVAAREKLFARRAELEDELRNLEHTLGTVQLGDLVDDTTNAKPLLERAQGRNRFLKYPSLGGLIQ